MVYISRLKYLLITLELLALAGVLACQPTSQVAPVLPTPVPACRADTCTALDARLWDVESRLDASDNGALAFGIGYNPNPNVTPQPTATPVTSISELEYLSFALTATVPTSPTAGRVYWNDDENTLDVSTNVSGTVLQVGRELYTFAVNKTASVILNGQAVYVSGAQGNRPAIQLANANTYTTAQSVGIATADIAVNEAGYVTVYGDVRGVDTRAYSAGDELWLASNGGGAITNTAPLTACKVFLGTALNSTVNGTINVNPDWRCDKFGAVTAGDYSDFEADGTLVFYGDARVWDDLRVPAQATRLNPGTTKPDYDTYLGNTKTFLFDPDAREDVNFAAQVPHTWDITYPYLLAHVHWTPTDAGAGNVVWGIECTTGAIGQTMVTTTVIYTATGAAGTAYLHTMTDLGVYTITNPTVSAMLVCEVYRDAADGADTYASDAALLETDFHYLINTVGSREEDSK